MSRIDSPFYSGPPTTTHQPFTTLNKEVETRQRILSIFNKELDDFKTKAEYDDYLEEREDIMFNLSQGIDVKATEAKVKAYQEREAESIARNEARRLERVLVTGGGEVVAGEDDQQMMDRVDDRTVHLMTEGEVNGVLRKQTKEEWERMASCSGWSRSFYEAQCSALYAT
jgi:hypothetical protein